MPQYVSGLIFTPELYSRQVKSLDIDIEPSVGILARKVDKLGLDIRSFKEPLKRAVKEVMIPSIRINFLKSGRPRWQDLSEETWAKKEGHGILRETDALMETMGQLGIWHIDGEKALIADLPQKVWYGKVHQGGASVGGGSSFSVVNIGTGAAGQTSSISGFEGGSEIPQRRFIMIQDEDEEKIEEIFDEWLAERIQRAGLGNQVESQLGPF